jgi:hypothetical protein
MLGNILVIIGKLHVSYIFRMVFFNTFVGEFLHLMFNFTPKIITIHFLLFNKAFNSFRIIEVALYFVKKALNSFAYL